MNVDYIAAINRDQNAPIFKMADFGVVGDLFRIIPAFIEELVKMQPSELASWQRNSTQ